MPAFRMKTKTTRERHSLHVYHKPTRVPREEPGLLVKSSLQDRMRESQDDASSSQTSDDCTSFTEVGCNCSEDEASDESLGSQYLASSGRVEAHSSAHFQTIFSPIIENTEAQIKQLADTETAGDDEQTDLPRLVADESDDGSNSPSECQPCSLPDDHVSIPSPDELFDEGVGFPDIISSASHNRSHVSSEMACDMEEGYMMLPFPENNLEVTYHDDFGVDSFNMDQSYLCLTIHQLKQPEQDNGIKVESSDCEDIDCFDPQSFFGNYNDIPETVSPLQCSLLPMETCRMKPVTLVLDLDETLVHSTVEHCDDADFTFPVFFNNKEHTVYVRKRPHLQTFLEKVAQMFEIIIFTASQSIYAAQLLDILDPKKKIISHRMYRESCVFSGGSYTKDLSILGVDLARVAIIDNSPQVFQLQINNGIPIQSWFDDPSDCALISLLPFLETLANAEDVRPLIAERFNNNEH